MSRNPSSQNPGPKKPNNVGGRPGAPATFFELRLIISEFNGTTHIPKHTYTQNKRWEQTEAEEIETGDFN